MNMSIVLIVMVAVLQSEACFPIGGGGGGTTTTAKTTTAAGGTTTKKTTTAATPTTTKKPDCLMENKNCLASDASNLVEIKEVTSAKLCSKYPFSMYRDSNNYIYDEY